MEFFIPLLAAAWGYIWFENKYLKERNQETQKEKEEEKLKARKEAEEEARIAAIKLEERERIKRERQAEEERKLKVKQEAEKEARIAAAQLEAAEQETLRIRREKRERERIAQELKAEEERKRKAKQEAEEEARIAAAKLKAAEEEILRIRREQKERERIAQELKAEEEKKFKAMQEAEEEARIAAIKLEEKERERIELERKAEEKRKIKAMQEAEKEARIAAAKLEAAEKEMLSIRLEKKERERIAQELKAEEEIKEVSLEKTSQRKQTNANLDDRSPSTPRRASTEKHPTYNSGIPELDGPGVWRRLNAYPQGHALYLFFSAKHNAYKVGVSEPHLLANRLKEIKTYVPDIRLNGLAVFTKRQNAFNKEQEVLERYKKNKYKGIKGRYVGAGEWITVRPTGRPYFTSPEKIEENFRKEIESSAQELDVPDNYTVYLLYSKSKNAYKCSWCNSNNLQTKIERAQKNFAYDAQLISRIRVEALSKARAIAQTNNKMSSSFVKEGRREEYQWRVNPEYLYLFEKWDEDGLPKKELSNNESAKNKWYTSV